MKVGDKTTIFYILFSNIMSTKQNTKSVSYCRNHNYAKHFEWTYDLNKEVSTNLTIKSNSVLTSPIGKDGVQNWPM